MIAEVMNTCGSQGLIGLGLIAREKPSASPSQTTIPIINPIYDYQPMEPLSTPCPTALAHFLGGPIATADVGSLPLKDMGRTRQNMANIIDILNVPLPPDGVGL